VPGHPGGEAERHTAKFWLMHGVRAAIPRTSPLATAEFATIRERLIKIGARVIEHIARIRVHLPTSCPEAALFRTVALCLLRRPMSRGAVCPDEPPTKPNASHSEWYHTDPAGRTASTRSLNRPEKCATSCIIAARNVPSGQNTPVGGSLSLRTADNQRARVRGAGLLILAAFRMRLACAASGRPPAWVWSPTATAERPMPLV
jgi:hypothetical protein